jgi:L-threonylcarbamoyladenylate synthase
MDIISNPTPDEIKKAAKALKDGHLVAFPTETVYGLGADASNAQAVEKIYHVKGRPTNHPLIVHVGSMEGIRYWADKIPVYAFDLAHNFWPGPMTLIFFRSDVVGDFITGGQVTVGLRIPEHVIALALLDFARNFGVHGIAAPSANRFGHVSPTTADAVREELSAYLNPQDFILNGGPSNVGVESTIIDCTTSAPSILRPGPITQEMIKESIGLKATDAKSEIRVSGSLENHYSPQATVTLNQEPTSGEGFIAMKHISTPTGVIRLAAPNSIEEYARILYSALRDGDSQGISTICVIPPTGGGLAIAIRDRLIRASCRY